MEENKPFKPKTFNQEEFDKYFIEGDDLMKTSCCDRRWYRTKKHMKCPGCKKYVDKDVTARGIMQGINTMMKQRKKDEENKNSSSSETSDDKS
tara:strand:- start:4572 stop:4850 length:279 start_codon:yes stop_codon:yes gene_type:complete